MVAKKNFLFSTYSYHKDSIKSQERIRYGAGQKFIVQVPATKKPTDLKLFLGNNENKIELYHLMVKVWDSCQTVKRLDKCQIASVVVEDKAFKLDISNGEVDIDF